MEMPKKQGPRTTLFLKRLGNRVKTRSPSTCGGRGNGSVRRVEGQRAGKQMSVPGHALAFSLA